jgi:hypothetical protein
VRKSRIAVIMANLGLTLVRSPHGLAVVVSSAEVSPSNFLNSLESRPCADTEFPRGARMVRHAFAGPWAPIGR